MFETMTQFLWFFFPTLVLIALGIIFEPRLIQFEQFVLKAARKAIHKCRRNKA